MILREIRPEERVNFNQAVSHPLQSWEWGEFRQQNGQKVIRLGLFEKTVLKEGYQITLHRIPKTPYQIGYLPKCHLPNESVLAALKKIGQDYSCIFLKLEPNVGQPYQENQPQNPLSGFREFLLNQGCFLGRPLFTKYTFYLDLTKSEADLFSACKPKTRYNIRLAQRYGVEISEDNSEQTFAEYLKLTFQTAKRQQFYAHNENYHRLMWQILQPAGIAHLLKASYQKQTLVTWILFIFNKILYYPYGASSRLHKEVMASNLMMWEAIRFGKKNGCERFDLWGSLGPHPNPKDPWFGFHNFKIGYSPQLIEFIGSFDLVINQTLYKLYNFADKLRWQWLKFKASLPI